MHLKRSIAVIGGDLRQRCLLRQLRGLGFPASAYRVPDAEDSAPDLSGCLRGANVLILPMPAGGGVPLADILDAAEPGALICGGMLDPAEALRLPGPLAGSRILLCGFGRIGKLLARKLKALGADVTVSARKAQALDLARILGYRRVTAGSWADAPAQYDGIVNTVPAPIIGPAQLPCIRRDCVLLELASLPGGFCAEAQALPGYCAARGLPGKYAPEAAAAIIRSAIFRNLNLEEAT